MNKETIIDRMQSYFSGENQNPEFDTSIEMDALQLFYVRTAKRLVIANELQKKDTIYTNKRAQINNTFSRKMLYYLVVDYFFYNLKSILFKIAFKWVNPTY